MAENLKCPPKTVIIHPGSTILRIGLATDAEPKILLHCIARKSARGCSGRLPGLFKSGSSRSSDLDIDVASCLKSLRCYDHVAVEDKLRNILNSVSGFTESDAEFIPFVEGFLNCDGSAYELQWPIVSGRFNDKFVINENVQNLADIWSYALTKYFDIPKKQFRNFSVLLAVEDIFIRREVRYIVNMLFKDLCFGRVMVFQTSFLHSAGVYGLTCCTVDLGFHKTSISCLVNSISLPEVRVNLPVGGSDCLRNLRAALEFYSRDKTEFYELLAKFEQGSYEDSRILLNAMFSADSEIARRLESQSLEEALSGEIGVEVSPGKEVSIPASAIINSHLVPFFPIQAEGCRPLIPQYQVPPADAPEPDDPLDDYFSRKRKPQGDEDSEESSSRSTRAPEFKDLAEAVAWSIRNAAIVYTPETEPESVSPDAPSDSRGDQLRQRLTNRIVLVGGGAEGVSGLLLSKYLYHKLQRLLGEDTAVGIFTRPSSVPDSAWLGARISLSLESAADLWITKNEWRRLGSRALREKTAFNW